MGGVPSSQFHSQVDLHKAFDNAKQIRSFLEDNWSCLGGDNGNYSQNYTPFHFIVPQDNETCAAELKGNHLSAGPQGPWKTLRWYARQEAGIYFNLAD